MSLTLYILKWAPNLSERALMSLRRLAMGNRRFMKIIARWAFMGKPTARHFFDHFLHASGKPMHIDTDMLLNSDREFRSLIHSAIREARVQGMESGTISVPQWSLKNLDLRYSVGSLEIAWKKTAGNILLSFQKDYEWHPEEPRVTRPIHQAADTMKSAGAAPFTIHGTPVNVSLDLLAHDQVSAIPSDRLYL